MAGEVLKMLAACHLSLDQRAHGHRTAAVVDGDEVARADVEPVLLPQPGQPGRAGLEVRGRPELHVRRMCGQVGDRFQVPRVAVSLVTVTVSVSEAGDGVRIDRSPGSRL